MAVNVRAGVRAAGVGSGTVALLQVTRTLVTIDALHKACVQHERRVTFTLKTPVGVDTHGIAVCRHGGFARAWTGPNTLILINASYAIFSQNKARRADAVIASVHIAAGDGAAGSIQGPAGASVGVISTLVSVNTSISTGDADLIASGAAADVGAISVGADGLAVCQGPTVAGYY